MSRTCLCVASLVVVLAGCGDDAPTTPPTALDELTVVIDRPVQLTKQARIPQHDPAYERAEVTTDTVIVHFSAPPTINLQVGDVIAGTGGANAYLRRVTEVTRRTARRVEVRTESAYLTDFIVDGAFTIDLKPAASSWEVDSDLKIGGKQLAVEIELSIFSFGPGGGFECTPVARGDPITIKPVLKPDFSHRMSVDITSKLWPITGELAGAEFSVDWKRRGRLRAGDIGRSRRPVCRRPHRISAQRQFQRPQVQAPCLLLAAAHSDGADHLPRAGLQGRGHSHRRDRPPRSGGHDGPAHDLADTWEWDGSTWTEVTPEDLADSPTTRDGHAMAYDVSRSRVVVFSGYHETLLQWPPQATSPTSEPSL